MKLIENMPAPGLCRCACVRNHPQTTLVGPLRPICDNHPDESGACRPCRTALKETPQ